MADIQAWVATHHERPDGRGYPRGIQADTLSLEAQILAVAEPNELPAVQSSGELRVKILAREP